MLILKKMLKLAKEHSNFEITCQVSHVVILFRLYFNIYMHSPHSDINTAKNTVAALSNK